MVALPGEIERYVLRIYTKENIAFTGIYVQRHLAILPPLRGYVYQRFYSLR